MQVIWEEATGGAGDVEGAEQNRLAHLLLRAADMTAAITSSAADTQHQGGHINFEMPCKWRLLTLGSSEAISITHWPECQQPSFSSQQCPP